MHNFAIKRIITYSTLLCLYCSHLYATSQQTDRMERLRSYKDNISIYNNTTKSNPPATHHNTPDLTKTNYPQPTKQPNFTDDFDTDLNDLSELEISTNSNTQKKSKLIKRLGNSISGSIGYSEVMFPGQGTNRNYNFLKLRYEDKFRWLKLSASGLAEDVSISIEQELDQKRCDTDPNLNGCIGDPKTRIIPYEKDRAFLEEGYAEIDIGSFAVVSAGKKKIIWGQFEPYSPINFAFPLNLGVTDLRFSKVKAGIGQEVVSLALYPTPKTSITGYYFPELTMDPLLENRLVNGFDSEQEPYLCEGCNGGQDEIKWRDKTSNSYIRPTGDDEAQHAVRLMFYPSWGTIGFTYHNGYDVKWDTSDFNKIAKIKNSSGEIFLDPNDSNNPYNYINRVQGISDQELFGFELSIPAGRWSYKFEVASIKTNYELNPNNNSVFNHALNETPKDQWSSYDVEQYKGDFELAKEYASWIRDKNNGNLYFDYLENIIAVGADSDLDRWVFNFAIFFIYPTYFSEEEKRIAEIEETAFPSDDEDDWPFYPMFNIGRYNKTKTSVKGIAAGVVGNGTGVALYYTREFKEALRLSTSILGIDYFSDDSVEEQSQNSGNRYEQPDGMNLGLGIRLEYQF